MNNNNNADDGNSDDIDQYLELITSDGVKIVGEEGQNSDILSSPVQIMGDSDKERNGGNEGGGQGVEEGERKGQEEREGQKEGEALSQGLREGQGQGSDIDKDKKESDSPTKRLSSSSVDSLEVLQH